MKKVSFIVPSILNTVGFLMLVASVEASTAINENDADLVPQIQLSSTISKEQIFDRKACDRAIARKHGELFACEFSGEKKCILMFELAKLYFEFARNSNSSGEKGAYYEEAEIYFKESKFPEAETYLVEISQFL